MVEAAQLERIPRTQKISSEDLHRALAPLGESAIRVILAHIRSCVPKTKNGYMEIQKIEKILQKMFGEASELLMRLIRGR